MGLLALGTPLPWEESRHISEHIRTEGVEQLLSVFKAAAQRDNDPLLWGDELEYMAIELDPDSGTAKLDVQHDDVLVTLNTTDLPLCEEHNVSFHPEYGRFMIEATPARPYSYYAGEFVEFNMQQRRRLAEFELNQYSPNIVPLTLTVFPRMGCPDFLNIDNPWRAKNCASRSLFLPDEVINKHARFPNLTSNIRTRRGEKVAINVPMYQDVNTPAYDDTVMSQNREWFIPEDIESKLAAKPGHIYMDAMGFGMGCSCLQITFQAPNIHKARYLYDAFVNLAPIMLSLSGSAPFFKGWLADQDVRWNVIASAVDDRTPFERGVTSLVPKYNKDGKGGMLEKDKQNAQRIPKSRYSSVDLYLGGNKHFNRNYNDTNVPVNDRVLKRLLENEKYPLDYDLAKHFAHLYIRDPVSTFEELIYQDNESSTNHFENIQSTNWQTLRFKPPTQDATVDNASAPGWRVEFRPMDVQITDFENAAYTTFVYLIATYFLTNEAEYGANPYIAMSKVWQNMHTAHHRDSVLRDKFYWKDDFFDASSKSSLYTLDEIFHNQRNGMFKIFINKALIHLGLITSDWEELRFSIENLRLYYYLKLISDRAAGRIPTYAHFAREFVTNHPQYNKDSRVSLAINADLIKLCNRITHLDNQSGDVTAFLGSEIASYLMHHNHPNPSHAGNQFSLKYQHSN